MKRSYILFCIALLNVSTSTVSLKGSVEYDENGAITTKKRNSWRHRGYENKGCTRGRRHRRWATWAVREQPEYHNEEPNAGRATMREGTNGVTFSARKMTM